jgi:hypothetical protein
LYRHPTVVVTLTQLAERVKLACAARFHHRDVAVLARACPRAQKPVCACLCEREMGISTCRHDCWMAKLLVQRQ